MEQFTVFNVNGKAIRGVFHIPDPGNGQYPAIVLCHGFTGNKIGLHRIFVKAARFFCLAGYAVLRFDFSGCGDSDGDHSEITVDGEVKEALAALDFLREFPQIKTNEIYYTGLSMGGAVAALAAARDPDLAGLVLWAPVANMYDEIRSIVGGRIFIDIWSKGRADFMGFALSRPFLESLQQNAPLTAARKFNGPVLVIHGTADREIPCQNAGFYKEARKGLPYSTDVHLVTGADHTFSALNWENEVFDTTVNWLKNNSGIPYKEQYSLLTG